MRLKGKEAKIKIFLFENIFIADEIDEQSEYCIAPATNSITESLFRHPSTERRIKKINECYDLVFGHNKNNVRYTMFDVR